MRKAQSLKRKKELQDSNQNNKKQKNYQNQATSPKREVNEIISQKAKTILEKIENPPSPLPENKLNKSPITERPNSSPMKRNSSSPFSRSQNLKSISPSSSNASSPIKNKQPEVNNSNLQSFSILTQANTEKNKNIPDKEGFVIPSIQKLELELVELKEKYVEIGETIEQKELLLEFIKKNNETFKKLVPKI